MEKLKILDGKKLEPVNKKSNIVDKIDISWRPPNPIAKSKPDNKKLVVKLMTNGKERRKILLKLESGSSDVHNGNFSLISELLKEFFRNGEK
jgi:hypothetical protein